MRSYIATLYILLAAIFCGLVFPLKAAAHPFKYAAINTDMTIVDSRINLHTVVPQEINFKSNSDEENYVNKNLQISYGFSACVFNLDSNSYTSANSMVIDGDYTCTRTITGLNGLIMHNQLFDDYFANVDHYVKLSIGEKKTDLVFSQQKRDYPKDVKPVPHSAAGRFFAIEKQFIWLGIKHIWTGYDHILFLLTVILLLRSVRQIVIIITSFTVAHSITLILAGLKIITLSPRIVEPLIATTILYMAIRNVQILLSKRKEVNAGERQITTTGFGLIHGLGFAGALLAANTPKEFFVLSLITFNLGVEIGQLTILAVIMPLLLLSDKLRWRRELLFGLSLITLILSLVWLFQRLFLT